MIQQIQNIVDFATAVRESTLRRFRIVPVGFENWKPAQGKMSIADIADHLIESDKWLLQKVKVKNLDPIDGVVDKVNIKNRGEYESLLKNLPDILNVKLLMIKNLTLWNLDEKIYDSRFGGEVTVWWIIMRGNIDHEIHHRGQLSAYLQMINKT